MHKAIILGAATLAALTVSTVAQAQGRQCFRTHNIENYAASDDEKTLYLRDTARHYFKIDFANRCTGLAYRERIVIRPFGTSDLVCEPLDMDFGIREAGISTKCVITDIQSLTPDEVKALPKKLKP